MRHQDVIKQKSHPALSESQCQWGFSKIRVLWVRDLLWCSDTQIGRVVNQWHLPCTLETGVPLL
jgi:hypothetical protein